MCLIGDLFFFKQGISLSPMISLHFQDSFLLSHLKTIAPNTLEFIPIYSHRISSSKRLPRMTSLEKSLFNIGLYL